MKALTKIFTAAVAAAAVASFAAPTMAAQTFATSTYQSSGSDFVWTHTATGGTLVGSSPIAFGTLTFGGQTFSTPAPGGTFFSFLDPLGLTDLSFVPVTFSFIGTSTSGAAGFDPVNSLYTQNGLTGHFEYIYTGAPTLTFGSYTVSTGANLLSGTFTNAWIQGGGNSGSTNVTLGNGGSVIFTSDFEKFPTLGNANATFAYNLIATPGFSAAPGASLASFTAHGDGIFSIPEPGTWALMIMGFGGVGALIRNRRRQAAFA